MPFRGWRLFYARRYVLCSHVVGISPLDGASTSQESTRHLCESAVDQSLRIILGPFFKVVTDLRYPVHRIATRYLCGADELSVVTRTAAFVLVIFSRSTLSYTTTSSPSTQRQPPKCWATRST